MTWLTTLKMLRGAMAECRMATRASHHRYGPVIDAEAKPTSKTTFRPCAKGRPVFQAVRENSEDAREWQTAPSCRQR
ncbi:MAG: hypothetical protein ACLTXH_13715 [Enterobacter hormaechei]